MIHIIYCVTLRVLVYLWTMVPSYHNQSITFIFTLIGHAPIVLDLHTHTSYDMSSVCPEIAIQWNPVNTTTNGP